MSEPLHLISDVLTVMSSHDQPKLHLVKEHIATVSKERILSQCVFKY